MFSAGSAAAGADLPNVFCIKLDYFWSNGRDGGLLALGLLKGDSFGFRRGSVVSSGSSLVPHQAYWSSGGACWVGINCYRSPTVG
jgi:hypothetical protein